MNLRESKGGMILVTGATGFIGSYLLYYLLDKHSEVRAMRRPTSSQGETDLVFKHLSRFENSAEHYLDRLARIRWVEAELLDEWSLRDALEDATEVYHCAARVSFRQGATKELLEANADGTALLVNLALESGVERFCHLSSVSTLYRQPGVPITEANTGDLPAFSSAYGESKYRAEMEVRRGMAEGLPAVILNPGTVLGWGNFHKGSAKIFKTIHEGLRFYPKGSNGFIDARDVAQLMIRLAETPAAYGQRYMAVGVNISWKEFFAQMAACLNVKAPSIPTNGLMANAVWVAAAAASRLTGKEPFVTREMAHISMQDMEYDSAKLLALFPDFSFTPIETTIRDTCAVYLEEEAQITSA